MKGFLSLVLVSIALLQMTVATPTASERSQALKKREGEQNVEKRNKWAGHYQNKPDDDDEDEALKKREGEQNVEKRNKWAGHYQNKPDDDDEDD
ncbi:hypothetical protein DFJ58DRAFT_144626 [Suillus subalutaceus]|uniref:uncharacterized protein n=1 Tax=Suillus subalutaceus TaxID=48586 RepID=UPI001B870BBB|nr:uncharacterized protein DFJ58DRAFT_144626 [Suillus subalutaceus]KAG1837554.1 hypothetical protein DFJ58DRAFT_144626 [Suillus subalutaceus]